MADTPARDLVTSEEIAVRLGYEHRQSVLNLWRRHPGDFPEPIIDRDRVKLWSWPQVQAWAERTGRWPPPSEPRDEP